MLSTLLNESERTFRDLLRHFKLPRNECLARYDMWYQSDTGNGFVPVSNHYLTESHNSVHGPSDKRGQKTNIFLPVLLILLEQDI